MYVIENKERDKLQQELKDAYQNLYFLRNREKIQNKQKVYRDSKSNKKNTTKVKKNSEIFGDGVHNSDIYKRHLDHAERINQIPHPWITVTPRNNIGVTFLDELKTEKNAKYKNIDIKVFIAKAQEKYDEIKAKLKAIADEETKERAIARKEKAKQLKIQYRTEVMKMIEYKSNYSYLVHCKRYNLDPKLRMNFTNYNNVKLKKRRYEFSQIVLENMLKLKDREDLNFMIALHDKISRKIDLKVTEKEVESYLMSRVRILGGLCLKFNSSSKIGVPDRIVIPGKADIPVFFVEVKSPTGRLSKIQKSVIKDFENAKARVYVVNSYDSVEHMIKEVWG